LGERYSGIVVGCERFGLFVMLDDMGVEGLVSVRTLGDEWFSYDADRMTLTGASTGRIWRLGQRVAVAVADVDIPKGRIDFSLLGAR
jgi:ribonuclease R